MEVIPLSLVKMDGEFFFAHDLGESAGCRDTASGQRRQAGAVDPLHLARFRDQLSGFVHYEDALGVRVTDQLIDYGVDSVEVLLLHHELGFKHRQLPL